MIHTDIFIELAKISSPSFKEDGVRKYILSFLKNLKISPTVDAGGNIYALIPGEGAPLILSAHMDTVSPCDNVKPIIKNGIIQSDGTTILGADDKAGIASILYLVSYLKENKLKHRTLEIIFTVQEEINCGGAKQLDYKKIKGKEAFVLDRSAPLNSITLSAPFAEKVEIICNGKLAHSRSPEDGIHAITMFVDLAKRLKYGRKGKKIISNIGVINGGKDTNSIPEKVVALGEIRGTNIESVRQEKRFWLSQAKVVSKLFKSKILINFETMIYGFSFTKNHALIKSLAVAIKKSGFENIEYTTAMGGSDANVFNQHGIYAIPLGQGRSGAHGLKESIPIKAFVDMHKILLHVILR